MSKHSAIVGGSTAGRLLACPGSYQAQLALPPSADISSEYANEGTAMHAVMDRLMITRRTTANITNAKYLTLPETWVGEQFHDRKLTDAHVADMIKPALQQLAILEKEYGGGFIVVGVEEKVKFPNIAGAFGTVDVILQSDTCVLHVDWKFGSGVGVKAVYGEWGDEVVNAQLLYYITAARATKPKLYTGKRTMVAAIIQPRSDEPLSHTEIEPKELRWFAEDLQEAVLTAIDRDPPRTRGEHCRFAPCKISCPLWTGPVLDLSLLEVTPRTEVVTSKLTPYGEYLARAKALVDILAMFKSEVDEQLHAYLEDGGVVPGWRLKAKTKLRQWVDAKVVEAELTKLGFAPHEIWQSKLETFKSTDATAKLRGVEIPDHLRKAPVTNETTICPTDDPAPVVNRAVVLEQFAASLKQLQAAK